MTIQIPDILNSPVVGIVVRMILIGLLTVLAGRGLGVAARQVEKRLGKSSADPERLDRLKTLVHAGQGAAWIAILAAALLMLLQTFEINITPLLAGAGVAGLALSLGAQTLIKDYIGGILIPVEDQFSIGDVIRVNDVAGGIERITLRSTYLRDIEGLLHIVPNGDIRTVSNLTAEWARAIVDLNVEYAADMAAVMRALEAASARARDDESINAGLLETPQALGWIGFKDWAVQVRIMAKTLPGKQWGIMMALRKYAMEALLAEGVRVALPSQDVRVAITGQAGGNQS